MDQQLPLAKAVFTSLQCKVWILVKFEDDVTEKL
jgi:hypothetical protein